MDSRGREADDHVAFLDARPVDEPAALDEPDARPGEVELLLAVDTRQLRRLAADERDTSFATDLGGSLHEVGDRFEVDAVRGHVVEEEERIGSARRHVVDAVRGEIGPARAQRSALAREDELRPDRVRGRGEEAVAVERMQSGERSESGRAGRFDGRAQPLDHRIGLRNRDARGFVGLLAAHGPSVQSTAWTSRPC